MVMMLITAASVVIAIVMAAIAWRLATEEKLRSEARVAALAAELEGSKVPEFQGSKVPRFSATTEPWNPGTLEPWNPGTLEPRNPGTLGFRRLPALLAGALVVALAIGTIMTLSLRSRPHASAAAAAATPAAQPLELVSLGYERAGDQLIVKGFVRNPAGAKPASRVSAVVFLFDRDGTFLTSGRALVDFLTLAPGEESPFVVQLPAAGSVGRYRVSFRNADGTVLPHVDRRSGAGASQAVRRQES